METSYDYAGDPGSVLAVFAMMFAFMAFFAVAALIFYVINSIFLMKLLKNAKHASPVAAWVPLWNTVALFQLGGIRTPWIWVLILFGGGFLSGIPYIGWVISLAVFVLSIMLTIWMAKGVQSALGLDSVGGIILAILLPFVWVIWMSSRSSHTPYSISTAVQEGSTFPFQNMLGAGEPYSAFPESAGYRGEM